MAEKEVVYRAEHVVQASPWDVYETLVDPDAQRQWRDQHASMQQIADQQPFTRVEFGDGMVIEIEPEGEGTLMRARKPRSNNGLTGRLGRWMTSRISTEDEMLELLKRIGASAQYGNI